MKNKLWTIFDFYGGDGVKAFLAVCLCFFIAGSVSAQKSRPVRKKSDSLFEQSRAEAKKLSPSLRNKYLHILRRLDAADTSFAAGGGAFEYFEDVHKVSQLYLVTIYKLPDSPLKKGMGLVVLSYVDSSVLTKISGVRDGQGGSLELTDQQKLTLGDIHRRHIGNLEVEPEDDVLSPESIAKIRAAAYRMKAVFYTFFEQQAD